MKRPITQIFWFSIDPTLNLKDDETWNQALSLMRGSEGYITASVGRGYEDASKIRLHVHRARSEQHKAFLQQDNGKRFLGKLEKLTTGTVEVMYVELGNLTGGFGHAFDAPLVGTALYTGTTEIFYDLVWPLWREIVKVKPGFRGIVSGKVLGGDGKERYLVYNGWESEEAHWNYWKGKDIDEKRGILEMGNEGRGEFYHLVFEELEDELEAMGREGLYCVSVPKFLSHDIDA